MVLTEAATSPDPATVTVAASPPDDAETAAPEDEIGVSGDELAPATTPPVGVDVG
jgi:hypothetical protein